MKPNKGFSAVEMIFVLAIGGAILTMTFMAISHASRSKRDAARKNDLARLEEGLTDWANNHSGIYPKSGTEFNNWKIDYNRTAPEGSDYTINYNLASTTCAAPSTVYYERISDRSYNIKMCLESGEVVREHS